MSAPGWQTDDLLEEWVEPESTSPPNSPPSKFSQAQQQQQASYRSHPNQRQNKGSIADKRGSLRSLGHAAPRGLPIRASSSPPQRIVSGHGTGAMLVPSGEFIVPSGTGLISPPPSSRSSSEGEPLQRPGAAGTVAGPGTYVVKEGVEDDRGGHLARLGKQGKDIFGKTPLEKMFEPPSPPQPAPSAGMPDTPTPLLAANPSADDSTAPLVQSPQTNPSPLSDPASVRRTSHPFAPRHPSRLSKSVTPSSNSSDTSINPDLTRPDVDAETELNETLPAEESQSMVLPEEGPTVDYGREDADEMGAGQDEADQSEMHQAETSMQNMLLGSGEFETDLSPLARGATRFPFTFNAPIRSASGATGSGTGSGSATIRGRSTRSRHAPTLIFDPNEIERDATDGPSHSTIHDRVGAATRQSAPRQAKSPRMAKSRNGTGLGKSNLKGKSPHLPLDPNLKLFRSTYDTYTRDHLSAIVDSIAVSPSPSPPSAPPGQVIRASSPETSPLRENGQYGYGEEDDRRTDTWSSGTTGNDRSTESASQSGSGSSDNRSSKRLRLSPASPPRRPLRDWGKTGLEILGRIKGRAVESTTSASPYQSGSSLVDEEGPTIAYPTLPPTPPLDRNLPPRPTQHSRPPAQTQQSRQAHQNHKSNPSTASSGYLRAAEAIMANIKQRVVSESASALSSSIVESSPGMDPRGRPGMSETEGDVGSSETDPWPVTEGAGHSGSNEAGRRGKRSGPSPRRMNGRPHERGHPASESDEDGIGGSQRQHRLSRQTQSGDHAHTDDLNRFVSSTTGPTCTTMSTSFVKHAGSKAGAGPGMRMIRPEEVNDLVGQSVGKMRYDPNLMRWIRDAPGGGGLGGLGRVSEGSGEESRQVGSEESVDVFAGFSDQGSRRGSGSVGHAAVPAGTQVQGADTDDHSDVGSNSSSDEDAATVANTTTLDVEALLDTSDSETESEDNLPTPDVDAKFDQAQGLARTMQLPAAPPRATTHRENAQGNRLAPKKSDSPPHQPIPSELHPAPTPRPLPTHANSAPAVMTPLPCSQAPRPIRSALRNPNSKEISQGTPILKKKASWLADLTPLGPDGIRSATRSVSFSDGMKTGPKILGLDSGVGETRRDLTQVLMAASKTKASATDSGKVTAPPAGNNGGGPSGSKSGTVGAAGRKLFTLPPGVEVDKELSGREDAGSLYDQNGASILASARTRRIQGLLEDMEDLSLNDMTPSKPSRNPEPVRVSALAPTPNAPKPSSLDETASTLPARSFRRSRSNRDMNGNATFLTECSFAVASDQLVKVITDVQPFEPYWESLREVDLSGKGLEGVGRLKEFLPALDEVNLNDNAISYLTGIPRGVRTLHVAGNRLSSLTSVDHLRNIQFLDLSRNQLDSVSQLVCLKHLRELHADHNRISTLSPILEMDSLVKVSAKSNRIDKLDLTMANWSKMESLDLAENGLGDIIGLETLTTLNSLNVDDNDLTSLTSASPLTALRTLRISRNDLALLDLAQFPKLRTLYADENRLVGLQRSSASRSKLEGLSMRSQRVTGLRLNREEIQGLKRLYLSGNDLPGDFFSAPSYQLNYLELAACRISFWPKHMAARMADLEVLNINYNYIEDLSGLKGMQALRKFMIVGNRLLGDGPKLAAGLKGLERLEEVDLRMNPGTLGFYLPLFVPPHTASSYSKPHLVRPNKTTILLGRPNTTLSASTRTSTSVFMQQETGADWVDMDKEFRKNLPDTWYGKRLMYRGVAMKECSRLRMMDGSEVGEGERRKADGLMELAARNGRGMAR